MNPGGSVLFVCIFYGEFTLKASSPDPGEEGKT